MNKFTEKAVGAFNLALECARGMGHSFGSQHLLCGLAAEQGGLAGSMLQMAGVTTEGINEVLERQGCAVQRLALRPHAPL